MAVALADRIAAAPISWGVCEAPDWGAAMPADRVLGEMRSLGMSATELGPAGYLGDDPVRVRELLDRHELRLVGGFVPVLLHAETADLADAETAIATLATAGAQSVVLAARSVDGDYEHRVGLDDAGWRTLLANLDRVRELAGEHGLAACLHPHVGTAISDRASLVRLLDSSDVPLCLDTGHLLLGGVDPLELVRAAADRVAHVHLKDVRAPLAAHVHASSLAPDDGLAPDGSLALDGSLGPDDSAARDGGYLGAVRRGMYAPLGDGDLDIAGIVAALEAAGYQGWYVLEQDCALEQTPPPGSGPVEDVRRSIDYLTASSI